MHSSLIGTDIQAEIWYLIRTNKNLDERLVRLLEDVASDNTSIDTVNLFVLKYIMCELSEQDLLIAINRHNASKQSIID